ncbi:MAG TPA: TonB-dependent receptor [Terriglobales bacterium]|nr:TonB-dependent receptor [Terriglobales bacterium]
MTSGPRNTHRAAAALALAVCLCLFASAAKAQTLASASISVQDQTGAMIPQAKIILKSTATGLQREATADSHGFAQIVNLPPGEYELRVEAERFKPAARTLRLEVGQSASIAMTMFVETAQEVTVSATEEGVSTYKAEVSEVLTERQIHNLPIKGRNFIDFVMLTPEVTLGNSTSVGSQAPFTEQTPKLSFGGVRETHSVFISLDGVDYTTGLSGLQRASPAQDWVQEFRVVSGSYESDVGRTLGGIVNTVTKSGTNNFHGGIYEFFRNGALNANNPLATSNVLRLNQFGANLGGPIAKEKTFFFTGYEGQRRGQSPIYSSFILATIDPNPATCPVLPPPGTFNPACISINGTKNFFGLQPENLASVLIVNDYDKFIGKVDHQFSGSTMLTTRYLFSDERNEDTPGAPPGLGLPSSFRSNPIRDQSVAANLIHTFSPQVAGDTVVQFARRTFHLDPVGAGREPFMALVNLAQSGGPVGSFTFYRENRLQVGQNVTYTFGNHTLKFGGEFHNIWNTTKSPMFTPGVAAFCPDSYFGTPNVFGCGDFSALGPTALVFYFGMPRSLWGQPLIPRGTDWESSLLPPTMFDEFDAASSADFTRQVYALYIQDKWRIGSRLTLTFGLRYDNETRPFHERDWYQPDRNNFQPRVGFAYSPDEKTVIRGGFGIYTGPFNWSELVGTTTAFGPVNGYMNNPFVGAFVNPTETLVGLAFFGPVGVVPGPFTAGVAFANFTATGTYPDPSQLIGFSHGFTTRDFPNPYAENASLQIERQLGKDVQISAGYSFIHALKIHYCGCQTNVRPDGFLPNGKQRLALADPNFGFAFLDEPAGYSIYHAGFITVNKRFSHHFNFTANYTWSKSIDNQTTIQYATGAENYLRKDLERAVSDNHVAHRFVLTGLADSPFRHWLAKNWTLGLTTTLQTPRYQAVQVGFDVNGDGFPFTDRVGLLGRNTYQGDVFHNIDLRVQRDIPFTVSNSEAHLNFSFEVFNLFNRANVLDVNNIYGAPDLIGPEPRRYGDGVVGANPGFGQPRSIADARQLQFSVRLTF